MSSKNKILDIESIDIKIAQLENSKVEYPQKLTELKVLIAEKEKKRDSAKQSLEVLEKNISQANQTLEECRGFLAQGSERLSAVQNDKEFEAVQKEIRIRKSKQQEIRNGIAKLKEKLPTLQAELEQASAEADKVLAQSSPVVEELSVKVAAIDTDIEACQKERVLLLSQIDEKWLGVYNLILPGRKKSGKTLSRVSNDSKKCAYCGQNISPNILKKIHQDEAAIVCENCGSLFVLYEIEQNS